MASRGAALRWVWFFGLISLALLLALGVYLLPLKPNLVALQFSFDRDSFSTVLSSWQPDGVALFRSHFPVDFVLLTCYGVFGYMLVTRTAVFEGVSPGKVRLLQWMMPAAALGDATENTLHLVLTDGGVHVGAFLYVLAGCSAVLKFVLIGGFLLLGLSRRFISRR
jgi:hypothetical protein